MNYGIFKGGKYLKNEGQQGARPARRVDETKKPRRRSGCILLILPVVLLLLYFFIKSRF